MSLQLSSFSSSLREIEVIEDRFFRDASGNVKSKDGIASSHPQLFINMYPIRDLGPVDDKDASLLSLLMKYAECKNFNLRAISNFISPDLNPKLQCTALQLLEHAEQWDNPNFTDNMSVTFPPVVNLILYSKDNLVHHAALDVLKLFLASPRATDIIKPVIGRGIVDVISNDLSSPGPLVQLACLELLNAAARSDAILIEFSAAVSLISITLPAMPAATQVLALKVLEVSAGSRTYELVKAVAETFQHLYHPLTSPESTVQIAALEVVGAAAGTKDPELAHVVKAFLAAVMDVESFSENDVRSAAKKVLEVAAQLSYIETLSLCKRNVFA